MSTLTDHDRRIIDHARQLAETRDLETTRKAAGSPAGLDVNLVYAEAFGVARVRLGDLIAIIERLDAGGAR